MGFQTIDKTYIENLPSVKKVVNKGLPYSLKTLEQVSVAQITYYLVEIELKAQSNIHFFLYEKNKPPQIHCISC